MGVSSQVCGASFCGPFTAICPCWVIATAVARAVPVPTKVLRILDHAIDPPHGPCDGRRVHTAAYHDACIIDGISIGIRVLRQRG